eukprot:GEMP01015502.1.p1 GENE.GEMP01015502.1~~GEMP01015502.1.p1  ORF type:complete len:346 (+),score=82.54 GEMP01015502.1:75-1112(+)
MSCDGAALFAQIPDDIFAVIFGKLNATSLRSTDATCKTFCALNRSLSLWRLLGARKFAGLELDDRGMFEQPIAPRMARNCNMMGEPILPSFGNPAVLANPTPLGARRHAKNGTTAGAQVVSTRGKERREVPRTEVNWKLRYAHFSRDVYEFRSPFDPVQIANVLTPDEVAYTKCRLRADYIIANPDISIYLEVGVAANADNLSLALVDFDEGGKSSVTFSPDTGAVIKETKVQESPRRVKGSYIQPVKPNFTKFEGKMGMYVRMGLIAFFRQYATQPWESTGFCVNFSWAKGKRLTPCLAFRDEGKYLTRITKVSQHPPFEPHWHVDSFDDSKWEELNWEGGPTT